MHITNRILCYQMPLKSLLRAQRNDKRLSTCVPYKYGSSFSFILEHVQQHLRKFMENAIKINLLWCKNIFDMCDFFSYCAFLRTFKYFLFCEVRGWNVFKKYYHHHHHPPPHSPLLLLLLQRIFLFFSHDIEYNATSLTRRSYIR